MPTGPSKGLSINEMDTNRNRYLIPSNKHSSCESMTELNGKRISANSHIKRKLLNETSLYTTFRWLLTKTCGRQPHVCRYNNLLTPKFGVTNRDQELLQNPTVLPKFPHKSVPKCLKDSFFTSLTPQNTIITFFKPLHNSPRMCYSKQVI